MAVSLKCNVRTHYGIYEQKVREKTTASKTMLRRWRRITSRRRAKRLKFKQQPMMPSSSPVREVSDQEDYAGSTMRAPERGHTQQQPEADEEPPRGSIDGQVTQAVVELEGLYLKTDNFTRGKSQFVEAISDEEKDTTQPISTLDDPEDGSQTSSEDSWACFPSSGSSSLTDSSSNSSNDEQAQQEECAPETVDTDDGPLPSPETTFKFYKFHEEFKEFELEEDEDEEEEEDDPRFSPTGPWASSAVPRWAFLRSSNSLPVLNLGPGDFYHGGSALRHEVSAEEGEDVESRGSQEVDMVGGVVHS